MLFRSIIDCDIFLKEDINYIKLADNIYIKDTTIKKDVSKITLCIRPEDIILNCSNGIGRGKILRRIYKGNIIYYLLKLNDKIILKVQTSTKEYYDLNEEIWFDINHYTIME